MDKKRKSYADPPAGNSPVGLREAPSKEGGSDFLNGTPEQIEDADEDLDAADPEAVILCRRCGHLITRPHHRITKDGSHHHSFANPAGLIFEIGCFDQAEGCGPSGEATAEFTWFRGFRWRLALCRACFHHLGWQFTSIGGSPGFWGLILNRLSFPI